jgi:hypothetical protein
MSPNEYDLGTGAGTAAVPAAVAPPADPFDMFPGVDTDEYPEILGRQPLSPGDYLFEVTGLAFDTNTKGTLLLQLKVVKPLQLEPGAPAPEGGIITERFNSFYPPPPGSAEGVQKAHKISVGRFKGAYHISTGQELHGRLDGPTLKQAKTDMIGKRLVSRVAWTKRQPKGSKEKAQRITYAEWLTLGKPEVYDNVTGFRAPKEGEV